MPASGRGTDVDAQTAAGERLPVQRHELEADGDAECRDGEIVAAQADRGEADDQRRKRRRRHGAEDADDPWQAEIEQSSGRGAQESSA